MCKQELYFSGDVETDGPIPGMYSMLSFGVACYDLDKNLLGTYEANLLPLEGAIRDPATMDWWLTQPDAWAACTQNQRDPAEVMPEFVDWVNFFNGKPVFMAFPAGFDFMFMYWYIVRFCGPKASPFSFSALDLKSFAMAMLRKPYRECSKRRFPKRWFEDLPHTHVAVVDAIEQGAMGINMIRECFDFED